MELKNGREGYLAGLSHCHDQNNRVIAVKNQRVKQNFGWEIQAESSSYYSGD